MKNARGTIVMLEGGHTTYVQGKTPLEVREMLQYPNDPTRALNPLQSDDVLVVATAVVALVASI
jgi:hypothetical protein